MTQDETYLLWCATEQTGELFLSLAFVVTVKHNGCSAAQAGIGSHLGQLVDQIVVTFLHFFYSALL